MPQPHRYPNFTAFISTGVIVGFVIGSWLGYRGDSQTELGNTYSASTAVLFIGLLGACVFGLLAAVVAVLLDRRR